MRFKTPLLALASLALVTTSIGACGGESRPGVKTLAPPTPTKKAVPAAKAEKPAAKPAAEAKADPNEVVFDPKNPPAGYQMCHRNHCHKVGGGVASYRQVMNEMGATRIKGQAKPAAMPKAPKDVAAAPANAEKTASGLASLVLEKGQGTAKPGATSRVRVHYTGWTTDGKAFDSSIARGKPAEFPLNRVIAGWTEGLQLMVEGESRRFWIPEELAYKGRRGRPQGMLVFDVELLKILN